ncbi:putative pentatricopeptide repeat-containing protein [Ananas comosus]|uniref:Putative pentatricopeptide repeat-containing protein n=1 Tax=Ananas comosus TaxID=4615 RepID=A0A199W0D6_ANACO|nr:putative pentatricopeptide repeat-containing protein [Ananas comosus]
MSFTIQQPLLFPNPAAHSITFLQNTTRRSLIRTANADCARKLFDEMPKCTANFSSHSSLVWSNTKQGNFSHALDLFVEFLKSGWSPDESALASLLKASSRLPGSSLGEQLHAKSVCLGLSLERRIRASLITMYSTVGLLEEARQVFDQVSLACEGDAPTWNSIMSAYAYHGRYRECFVLFVAVLGVAQPLLTDATYAIYPRVLVGENVEMGKMIHAMIVKEQMVEDKTKMLNSLITMYAKCGRMMTHTSLDLNEEYENAIDLFRLLTRPEGRRLPKPNSITFLSVLSCVSSLSAWRLGGRFSATD